ncbi:MAG: hypothetical protein KAT34_20025, partial [Candidatus Aminicenantes bacterium]|nr:hypothetical protein [Candidatus Aminicenantes bacterium]
KENQRLFPALFGSGSSGLGTDWVGDWVGTGNLFLFQDFCRKLVLLKLITRVPQHPELLEFPTDVKALVPVLIIYQPHT